MISTPDVVRHGPANNGCALAGIASTRFDARLEYGGIEVVARCMYDGGDLGRVDPGGCRPEAGALMLGFAALLELPLGPSSAPIWLIL